MTWDIYNFFRYLWAIPWLFIPLRPYDSGNLSELSPTPQNLWCLAVHGILFVLQFSFIWIFVNGVGVGEHWLRSNLNRLALTFKRPILGIHNRTLSKVVLILHSQGGIEGGLVVDWILQELPQDLLSKLEVYTFGNAANHFNNPHRHMVSQQLAKQDPTIAVETMTTTITQSSSPAGSPSLENFPEGLPSQNKRNSMTSIQTKSAAHDRAIAHVEHYAHTTDFVALWGVLHFATSSLAAKTVPRFIGRLFIRPSKRGGHQFCQHYLDGMFPLERDAKSGKFLGAAESNEFMDSIVQVGMEGDVSRNSREAFAMSWLGNDGFGSGDILDGVDVHGNGEAIDHKREIKVKDLSRLWLYRNGRSPDDLPPIFLAEPPLKNTDDED
ncbi:unnamed protein product [Parascedosporium putredinis]|uniref:Alpha/beta-hydrolase n=1 Tax=Parascedosporium putredinis TaxID=1442378 RepID=A0A9P1MGM6_9PEZI|nr:unnamed protein product [Parascedosporium putredinis]CAI8004757.1 unnamed protein product [Parascedosporium putredinis]